jgi:predicted nuclease of predicted toxin-antitoxin system
MNPEDWYFVIDENLEPRVVELLEAEGFRADRVSSDILFRGAEDVDDVIEHAVEQDAIIVTNNWRDFKRKPRRIPRPTVGGVEADTQ